MSLKNGLVSETFSLFPYDVSLGVVGFVKKALTKLFLAGVADVRIKWHEKSIMWKVIRQKSIGSYRNDSHIAIMSVSRGLAISPLKYEVPKFPSVAKLSGDGNSINFIHHATASSAQ